MQTKLVSRQEKSEKLLVTPATSSFSHVPLASVHTSHACCVFDEIVPWKDKLLHWLLYTSVHLLLNVIQRLRRKRGVGNICWKFQSWRMSKAIKGRSWWRIHLWVNHITAMSVSSSPSCFIGSKQAVEKYLTYSLWTYIRMAQFSAEPQARVPILQTVDVYIRMGNTDHVLDSRHLCGPNQCIIVAFDIQMYTNGWNIPEWLPWNIFMD